MPRLSSCVVVSATFAASFSAAVSAQSNSTNGCLRLLGSIACPAFEGAYINPANLSDAFPWMAGVTNVAQFDAAALNYFSDTNQYSETQFVDKLGCSNATGATLRYARTVLCSMWTNGVRSRQCSQLLDSSSVTSSPRMVCQSTCEDYALSERNIVASSTLCPGPDLTGGYRQGNITKDYVQCTDWTTLATNNTSLCVLGSENEGNCGYGSSISQLCSFCNPANGTPGACCYRSNTNIGTCGYTLPALSPSSSAAIASASASRASAGADGAGANATAGVMSTAAKSKGLSGGAIAGIVIGALVGLLVLLLLLLLLLRRRRNRDRSNNSTLIGTPPASSGSTFVARFFGGGKPEKNSAETQRGTSGESGRGGLDEKKAAAAAAAGGVGLGVTGAGLAGAGAGDRDAMGGAQDGMVHPGEVVTVLWAYSSTLPDELDLRPGMKLRVVRLYDDAWATGELVSGPQSGRQGAFPLVCVTLNGAVPSSDERNSFSSRRSSASEASPRGASLSQSSLGHHQGGRQTPLAPLGGPVQNLEGPRPDSPLDPFDRP